LTDVQSLQTISAHLHAIITEMKHIQ